MKLTFDTIKGDVTAELIACDPKGRYDVPLANAICRNTPCVPITHAGEARFHYFHLSRDGERRPAVTFNLVRSDQNNSTLVDSLVRLSQEWLSQEIGRLLKLHADIETLEIARKRETQ